MEGPRPVPAWFDEADEAHEAARTKMVFRIVRCLRKQKPRASPIWLQKLPTMAEVLERWLFEHSTSFDQYCNKRTIAKRLKAMVVSVKEKIERYEAEEEKLQSFSSADDDDEAKGDDAAAAREDDASAADAAAGHDSRGSDQRDHDAPPVGTDGHAAVRRDRGLPHVLRRRRGRPDADHALGARHRGRRRLARVPQGRPRRAREPLSLAGAQPARRARPAHPQGPRRRQRTRIHLARHRRHLRPRLLRRPAHQPRRKRRRHPRRRPLRHPRRRFQRRRSRRRRAAGGDDCSDGRE